MLGLQAQDQLSRLVLGIQIQIFTLVQQAFYVLKHFPSLQPTPLSYKVILFLDKEIKV